MLVNYLHYSHDHLTYTEAAPSHKQQSESQSKSPYHVPLTSNDSHGSQSSHATSTTTSQSESDQLDRPSRLSSQQSSTVSPSHMLTSPGHVVSPVQLPSRVPPPSGVIATASRNKDGFFVAQKKPSGGVGHVIHIPVVTQKESEKVGSKPKAKAVKRREFVVKDGALQRSKPWRNAVRNPKSKSPSDEKSDTGSEGASNFSNNTTVNSNPSSDLTATINFQSNMKRSFRYRKITLRAEKPIFADNSGENSDSEDEGEETNSGAGRGRGRVPTSLVPGPKVDEKGKLPKLTCYDPNQQHSIVFVQIPFLCQNKRINKLRGVRQPQCLSRTSTPSQVIPTPLDNVVPTATPR